MAKHISINVGFITNSSSVVHHFPREVLEDPDVQAFMKTYEVEGGFVGSDMWHRGQCDTFAITQKQKRAVQTDLLSYEDCSSPGINVDSDDIVIVYGDEYSNLVQGLCDLISQACKKKGIETGYGENYN